MTPTLRVLIVEDSEDDMHLILREIRRGEYEVTFERVENPPAMQSALAQGPWDLILCDYTLPGFSASAALKILKESGADLPFFVISGTIKDARTRRLQREAEAERRDLIARLEMINSEIERFTYLAFHDLRAPLVTIKGFIGALKQDLDAGREEQVRTHIRRIEGAADKMNAILSDLLEFARIGRVQRPSEDVRLDQLVQEVLQALDKSI